MRYGQLTYWTENLGDTIQSVAAETYLPRVDLYVDRDGMADTRLEREHFLLCNGWWMHPRNQHFEFPLSPYIQPFFVSVHISAGFRPNVTSRMLHYLQEHAPIGCRDRGTQRFLDARGVPCYYSSCLTLTLPRSKVTRSQEVLLVDVGPDLERHVPRSILNEAVKITHTLDFPKTPEGVDHTYTKQREQLARHLLHRYARARLVVTGRIHCALPCLALGTPVVFLFADPASEWERLGPLRDFLPIYTGAEPIDWNPRPPDVSGMARPLRNLVARAVATGRHPLRDDFTYLRNFVE